MGIVENHKLTILLRVESGCLGENGAAHIAEFCIYAAEKTRDYYDDYIIWKFQPREDKALSEMAYFIGDKKLKSTQAEQYLTALSATQTLGQLEEIMQIKLVDLVDEYRGSRPE